MRVLRLCSAVDVKLDTSRSAYLQKTRRAHARSETGLSNIMLQRHFSHVPHETSHLCSLRRLRYHTEVLALVLAGIVPILLCLSWLLLGLLLWL